MSNVLRGRFHTSYSTQIIMGRNRNVLHFWMSLVPRARKSETPEGQQLLPLHHSSILVSGPILWSKDGSDGSWQRQSQPLHASCSPTFCSPLVTSGIISLSWKSLGSAKAFPVRRRHAD